MKKNKQTLIALSGIVIGMFCMAFAAVPLYDLFCKVTGYGGTTNRVDEYVETIGERELKIFFNADISPDLKWEFKPKQRSIKTIAGKRNVVFYTAKNISDEVSAGTASYNVTPLKAGSYFSKIECFCFTKQVLNPGQEIEFPVFFYVDKEIETDPYLKEVKDITLSYSFFKTEI